MVTMISLVSLLVIPGSAQADPYVGALDGVNSQMVDNIYGWACDTQNPSQTWSTTSIVIYRINATGSVTVMENQASGVYRPEHSSACGGFQYSGFALMGWYITYPFPNTFVVFAKNTATGQLTWLGTRTLPGHGSY